MDYFKNLDLNLDFNLQNYEKEDIILASSIGAGSLVATYIFY